MLKRWMRRMGAKVFVRNADLLKQKGHYTCETDVEFIFSHQDLDIKRNLRSVVLDGPGT
jgi:hypothetical protein